MKERRRALRRSEHQRKERVLTQPRSATVARTTEAIVCKYKGLFLTTNEAGDVPHDDVHGVGLYLHDCRYLDGYELLVEGQPPTPLSTFSSRGFETVHYLANPDIPPKPGRPAIPQDSLVIRRERVIRDDRVYETIELRDHGWDPIRARVKISFRSRFDDIFVVRGFVRDSGTVHRPRIDGDDTVVLGYAGLDGLERTTTITFSPAPTRLRSDSATFDVEIEPGKSAELAITITPREHEGGRAKGRRHPEERRFRPSDISEVLAADEREWLSGFATVESEDPLFNEVMRRALLDLRLLRTEREDLHFVSAGIPWFATLFGRDSCIVGLQTLPFGPRLASETLRLLARLQAAGVDDYREAEPGKILHELRTGELANADRIPQSPAYYGSVDATLLWTILLGQYVNWTGDADLARSLKENLDAAVEWSVRYGDHDGDGYIDYSGKYERGLVNQGWKDSGRSIVNADGSLATPPIALCEVQSYAYRAWRSAARLYALLGDERRCEELCRRAEELRVRFEREFWSERLGCYVLARQKDGRPCEVVASNTGQVLWGGIASPERAARVAERLMREDMFSGWGIRTLASGTVCYNPSSYHLGSVWPHDNSLIVGGLRRYGHDEAAERIFSALFDAASHFPDFRMPELYGGYPRRQDERAPVSYPVACNPQAWAAGALPYALWQMLGIRARAREGRVVVARPRLPPWLPWLEIRGLECGGWTMDLRFERDDDGRVRARTTRADSPVKLEQTA